MAEFKRILVATDFGESSEQAVLVAVELAERLGASVTLLHVYEVPEYVYFNDERPRIEGWIAPIQASASKRLEEAMTKIRSRIPGATSVLLQGRPGDEIVRAVGETHPDLVVIGTHGRRGVAHALLGSVAERVVRMASAPVLTVRSAASAK